MDVRPRLPTETLVFRESCFCSDRAVFDTIDAIIHTQLVTTVRSVLVELTACPPKYRRNLHVNYVPPNLPVALISLKPCIEFRFW